LNGNAKPVSSKSQRQLFFSQGNRIREIALMLLASLSWASTAELTHSHQTQSASRLAELQSSSTSNDQAAPRIESSSKDGPSGTRRSSSECSICQLHQNLFASLFTHRLYLAPAPTQHLCGPAELVSFFAGFKSPQQGRAPPSLL
jgi:hypothetical protein